MRLLLILATIPSLVWAQSKPKAKPRPRPQAVVKPANLNLGAGFGGALQAPVMLQGPYTYPVNGQLGQYQLPVNPTMFSQCPPGMNCPGIPGYLAHFNRGIPGMNGPNQPASGFNILRYGPNPNDPMQTQFPRAGSGSGGSNPLSQIMSMLGGGGSGSGGLNNGGSGYSPGSYGGGGSYGTQSGPVDVRPNSLCRGKGESYQSKQQSELGGLSPCDIIYNTLRDGCTGEYVRQLANIDLPDMENYCPGWNRIKMNETVRLNVLMNFVAAVVNVESSWNTKTESDFNLANSSKGLLQLTKETDRKHGCECRNLNNEYDIRQNLQCGTQMIVSFMARDGVVAQGSRHNFGRGVGKSFGPFRPKPDGSDKPALIRIKNWVSDHCRNHLPGNTPGREESPPATSSLGLQPRQLVCVNSGF